MGNCCMSLNKPINPNQSQSINQENPPNLAKSIKSKESSTNYSPLPSDPPLSHDIKNIVSPNSNRKSVIERFAKSSANPDFEKNSINERFPDESSSPIKRESNLPNRRKSKFCAEVLMAVEKPIIDQSVDDNSISDLSEDEKSKPFIDPRKFDSVNNFENNNNVPNGKITMKSLYGKIEDPNLHVESNEVA